MESEVCVHSSLRDFLVPCSPRRGGRVQLGDGTESGAPRGDESRSKVAPMPPRRLRHNLRRHQRLAHTQPRQGRHPTVRARLPNLGEDEGRAPCHHVGARAYGLLDRTCGSGSRAVSRDQGLACLRCMERVNWFFWNLIQWQIHSSSVAT